MNNCLFCKIIRGEIQSYKVYEDDSYFGFLDIHPLSVGHTLLVPKKHTRWVYETDSFGRYWETVYEITEAIRSSLSPKWVNYFTYGEIPHAHIHILPRFDDMETKPPIIPAPIRMSKKEFLTIAKKISSSLSK
jgi:histidine triad (HIT) family protein